MNSYGNPQYEPVSQTQQEWDEAEKLGEDQIRAEGDRERAVEDAYAEITSAVEAGFRAGLKLSDIKRAFNDAMPWKTK